MIRVVVVEDEEYLRRELVLTIPWERLGCVIVGEAADGRSGLELILRIRPELLLTDIRMPGLDGIAMVEAAFRELPAAARPAVVILSGHSEFEYARSALRLGVQDFLIKPLDDEELLRVMDAVTARISETGRQQEAESRLEGDRRAETVLPRDMPVPSNGYAAQAIRYLTDNLERGAGLAEAARELGITESYLCRLFSEGTGYTLIDYLTRLRVRTAADLLRDRSLRVKEVMARCGYRDPSYFGQVFRRLMGVTPSGYREHFGRQAPAEDRRSR